MATHSPMHNFTTLIKRLEAATSRLEDIAQSAIDVESAQQTPLITSPTATPQSSTPAPSTRTPVIPPPPPPAAPKPAPPAKEELPEEVEDFNTFVSDVVEKWVKLSDEIGGPVAEQAKQVLKGYQATSKFIHLSTKAKRPDLKGGDATLYQNLIQPIANAITAVNGIKDKAHRSDPFFNHLSAVADSIIVLAWPTIPIKPYKHVQEARDSAQFFGNKVITANKESGDAKHLEWVKSYYNIFPELITYVKEKFSDGLKWNANGPHISEVAKALANASTNGAPAAPAPPAGGAPPPPPPPGPPPVLKINEQKAEPAPAGGLGAVFSELNQGEAVTKGLRKVDKSEMTHKNPSLRASSVVSEGSAARGKSPAPGKKPKPESMRVKKPSKKVLEGNKWTIENYDSPDAPIEIDVEMSHSILISKCTKTTIILRGKANAVTIENTNRLSLVVEDLVSTVDAVKSQNFALQVMGTIPTVLLDQVDSAQIYFSKESSSTRVFTSKSTGVNVNVLGADDDYKELALPDQICSHYDEEKGEMVNEIVSHAG
ncbi:putative adenylyl cyclase-associated protein [Triangularia verruculosa]|uniref:Adenylyl cyclase-associated protein n=1 Tax=Triangularia verruculosa TaxID=2587418 RepID=A0AAN6XW78_9PEZI|nr:putative adenylyl cyclase-associated protein [Triangularia verruculosa]